MIALEGFEIEYPTTATDARAQTLVRADYDGHMDWDNGGFWVMLSVMAVFWLGLLGVIAWGVATYARKDGRPEESAHEIARRRYARGEINAEEFERIKRDLR
ncbi:MAG: SHOCT domain-containing protein [Dehalococcoidia bacterium]